MPCSALCRLPLKLWLARSSRSLKDTTSASLAVGVYSSWRICAKAASRTSTKSAAFSMAVAATSLRVSSKSARSTLPIGKLKLTCIPSGLKSLPNSLTRKLSKVGTNGLCCSFWVIFGLSSKARISSAAMMEAEKPS